MSINIPLKADSTNNSWLNFNINDLQTKTLEVNGMPYLVQNTGTYNANISVTGCNNVLDPQTTHFVQQGNFFTIFGYFRGDVQAVNSVTLQLDIAPGTTSSLANRTLYFGSNKGLAGSKAFIAGSDGNVSPTRVSLTTNTYDQSVCVAANQLNTTFYYNLTYISS